MLQAITQVIALKSVLSHSITTLLYLDKREKKITASGKKKTSETLKVSVKEKHRKGLLSRVRVS